MKKLRFLSLILSMVLCVAVCDFAKARSNEPPREIICVDGKYYLEFPDELEKPIGCGMQKYIYYSSMDEFYSKVTSLDFSEKEVSRMRNNFSHNDIGIYLCDMNNLYQPILPDDCTVENIAWTGNQYYVVWSSDKIIEGHFSLLKTYDIFEKRLRDSYNEEYFQRDNVEVLEYYENCTDTYKMVGRKYVVTTEYGQTTFRKECYERLDDSNYKAVIEYIIESDADYYKKYIRMSDVIPYDIRILGNDGTSYWEQHIFTDYIKDAVSPDWLMSFGIEPYIPE